MPSDVLLKKETDANNTDFSLDEKLQSLESKKLYDLIEDLMEKNPENYRLVLEWFKKKKKHQKDADILKEEEFINDELLMEYWENARTIISEFNEYGGGPEDKEEEAYDWLDKVSELIKEMNISKDTKLGFLDEAFKEYNVENSGFEDSLMDTFFEICKTKEEWQYLVEKLGEQSTRWRRGLIMQIQKEYLEDDDAYLKMRHEDLHYGTDYWDMAKFYIEKGEIIKGVEIAEEGLIKGKGRLTDLFEFLSDYYAKNTDTANLERIAQYAFQKKSYEKEILDRLFEYYKAQDDYESAKKALLKAFDYVKGAGYISKVRSHTHYNKMKQFLLEADWKNIEPRILQEIRRNDLKDYLRICLDKGLKKDVLQIILDPPINKSSIGFRFNEGYDFDEFANQLKEAYPEDIIEYYWKEAYSNIQDGNRGTYSIATEYLEIAKYIYSKILNEESKWEQRFSDLKVEFKKRPAFLDEVKKL